MRNSFVKIKKVPSYRKLADAILEKILDGRLKEGSPLPTEALLCEMFDVNRSTVREGIRVLEEAKMIRRECNAKTMFISRPSNEETGAHVERALQLQKITLGELWEAILTIEPMLARLAAEKLDECILAQIDANLEKTEFAIKKNSSLIDMDTEFHTLIAAMSTNRALNMAREPIAKLFYTPFVKHLLKTPNVTQDLLKAHQAIANAICSKNADEAEYQMRKHVHDMASGLDLTEINMDMLMPRVIKLAQVAPDLAGR